jgi:pimeloyl-ACP methyl ester carboxylesterase
MGLRSGPLRHRWWRAVSWQAFRLAIPNRRWVMPRIDDISEFHACSRDGVPIAGWKVTPNRPRGTIIIAHGITRNCTMDGIPAWGRFFSAAGYAVVAIDLRGHGHSANAIGSFAVRESGDIRGAIDACVEQGLPRPYIVCGGSLGALAAQRAAIDDERVAAAILLSMPAWPWQGIRMGGIAISEVIRHDVLPEVHPLLALAVSRLVRALGRSARVVASMVNAAHGYDILAQGDIRRLRVPAHTAVLAVTGEHDTYDWRMTAYAWRYWHRGRSCRMNLTPLNAPEQRTWLVVVPGLHHPPVRPHVLDWEPLKPLLLSFLELVSRPVSPGG